MTTPTLDALRQLAKNWREQSTGDGPAHYYVRQCAGDLEAVLSAALASEESSPPTTDDTHAVIEEGKRVSDNPDATPADLRFALNAAIHQLGEQREMYRARLRETEQDAKLRVRAALASASACDVCHGTGRCCPDEVCDYCDGTGVQKPPRAPETLYLLTGWRERAACLRRDGKAEASAAMDACADELRAALLRVPRAQETARTIGHMLSWRCSCGGLNPMSVGECGHCGALITEPAPPPPSESRT